MGQIKGMNMAQTGHWKGKVRDPKTGDMVSQKLNRDPVKMAMMKEKRAAMTPTKMAMMKNKRASMSADSRYKPNKTIAEGAVIANRTPAMMKQIKAKRIAEGGRGHGAYARAGVGGRPIRPSIKSGAGTRIASALKKAAPKPTAAPAPAPAKKAVLPTQSLGGNFHGRGQSNTRGTVFRRPTERGGR